MAVPGISPNTEISAIAFYACRNVKKGEELFLHYGDSYDRSHYVNNGASVGHIATLNEAAVPKRAKDWIQDGAVLPSCAMMDGH